MKTALLRRFAALLLLCTSALLTTQTAYAAGEIRAGKEFYSGLPAIKKAAGESTRGGAPRFTAYAYGNYNATTTGFAYGDPVEVNYALNLEPDIIDITSTSDCGTVQGVVKFSSAKGATPVGLSDIYLDKVSSYNYVLTPSTKVAGSSLVSYTLNVTKPQENAYALLVVVDRTGQRRTVEFTYQAQRISANAYLQDLGTLAVGTQRCTTITLSNPTNEPVQIVSLSLASGSVYSITPLTLPVTVLPGASIPVEVCIAPTSRGTYSDSLVVGLSCYHTTAATLRAKAGEIRVTMGDWNFGETPVGSERSRDVVIENIGDLPVELTSVDWTDKAHFRTEELEASNFPIVLLNQGDKYTFRVFYTPTAEESNSAVATFTGNTAADKVTSAWSGVGKIPVSVRENNSNGLRLYTITPQPLSGVGTVHYSLDKAAEVSVSLYTIIGERILLMNTGMQTAGTHSLSLDVSHLPSGMYLCKIDAGGHAVIQSVIVR